MKALILGIGGQDGSYLAEILLEKGYEVHGLVRRSSVDNLTRIAHIRNKVTLHQGDITDLSSVHRIINKHIDTAKLEIYNEADQDSVPWSTSTAGYSASVTYGAVAEILEMLLDYVRYGMQIKFFQPLSATMFGDYDIPQDETTQFKPMSPYACAKAAAYHLCRFYREAYGMFVSTAIMYNHDSPRRSEEYLLHKICNSAVRIAVGKQDYLTIGSLDMELEIGYAKDYMEGAYSIMQLDSPDDFVLSLGESTTIRNLIYMAFDAAGIKGTYLDRIKTDTSLLRPGRQPTLVGNSAKAIAKFGWKPKHNMQSLIGMLVLDARRKLE